METLLHKTAHSLRTYIRGIKGMAVIFVRYMKTPGLNDRLLSSLSSRAVCWLVFMLICNGIIFLSALSQGTAQPRSLPVIEHIKMSMASWTFGLYALAGIGFFLGNKYRSIKNQSNPSTRIESLSIAWSILIILASFWWTLGVYTLQDQPRPTPNGPFVLAQRTFLWLTALGHVISLVLLASSWKTLLCVLTVGFFMPAIYFLSGIEGSIVSIFWLTGQMTTYVFVSLFLHFDQRRLLIKQLCLEAERKRADDLLQQRKNLLGAISHDLKQPLTTIGLRLDSVRDYMAVNPLAADTYRVIEGQLNQMTGMINSALDLARIEAGIYPINKRELPLHQLLEDVVDGFKDQADRKGIKLKLDAPPLIVKSDYEALTRIVCNLTSNAIKYTPQKGTVFVKCKSNGIDVRIYVIDTGKGIEEEHKKLIFNEYVQLDNPERDSKKGIGIGLSVVDKLANLLDHKIRVHSKIDKGSCFCINVPLVGKVPNEYLNASSKRLEKQEDPDLYGMAVILVEDDIDVRETINAKLSSWGCYVIAGESFDEIKPELNEMLGSKIPDLLITDYKLREGRTGLEVVDQFREIFPNLPSVVLSGESDSITLKKVSGRRIDFIAKPISRNELVKLLLAHRPSKEINNRVVA